MAMWPVNDSRLDPIITQVVSMCITWSSMATFDHGACYRDLHLSILIGGNVNCTITDNKYTIKHEASTHEIFHSVNFSDSKQTSLHIKFTITQFDRLHH